MRILISAAITLPGTCLGKLTGFAINPARDFAPRLFSAIVFGPGALTVYKKWGFGIIFSCSFYFENQYLEFCRFLKLGAGDSPDGRLRVSCLREKIARVRWFFSIFQNKFLNCLKYRHLVSSNLL